MYDAIVYVTGRKIINVLDKVEAYELGRNSRSQC
jgi:hypothetical protein